MNKKNLSERDNCTKFINPTIEKAGLGNLKTVGNYLKELENNGFLKSEQVGKEKLYLNFRLLEVLKKK